MRLAPEETSADLTGYGHNAVTCIGMKTDIPVKIQLAVKDLPFLFPTYYGGVMLILS